MELRCTPSAWKPALSAAKGAGSAKTRALKGSSRPSGRAKWPSRSFRARLKVGAGSSIPVGAVDSEVSRRALTKTEAAGLGHVKYRVKLITLGCPLCETFRETLHVAVRKLCTNRLDHVTHEWSPFS